MNEYPLIVAIRELPPRYVTPGVNVTGFGDAGIVAAHPNLPSLIFKDGKWKALTLRQGNKRR